MEILEQRVGKAPADAERAPWLLLHGAWSDASEWAAFQDACDELGVPSRAISLPGHGASTLHKGELRHYSIRDAVRIVLGEVERMQPEPLLVGRGLGAWLALRAAEECDVRGVVLIDGLPLRGVLGRALRAALRHPLWAASNLANGFESPWRGRERLARELLGTDAPRGAESRGVLRELLHRPIAHPELVRARVLLVERDAAPADPELVARLARVERAAASAPDERVRAIAAWAARD